MTNENLDIHHIADIIEDSVVGADNALTNEESTDLATLILRKYLVVRKEQLPEAKQIDNNIYAGSQAVNVNSKPDDILEKALSYLSAAAKLTTIQEELKAAKDKEMNGLLEVINEQLGTAQKIKNWGDMSFGELAAAREIKRLRNRLANSPLAG